MKKIIKKGKTNKRSRKLKKNKSKKLKNKLKKNKVGGVSSIYKGYILNEDEPPADRFEIELRELRKVVGRLEDNKTLSIIDKTLNNRYIFNKKIYKDTNPPEYNVLIDPDNETYYAFDQNGNQLLNEDFESTVIKKALDIEDNEYVLLKKYKITLRILKNKKGCYEPYNLNELKLKLKELNDKLHIKCPELSLIIDNNYELKGEVSIFSDNYDKLVLCLYYKSNCISSIVLNISHINIYSSIDTGKNDTVVIETYTSLEYQGNKFNKLLSFITIILCSMLKCNEENTNVKQLISVIANPISAWLLISNFDVEINDDDSSEFNKQIAAIKLEPENSELTDLELKKKLIFDEEKNSFINQVMLPLNDQNVEKANFLFNEMITSTNVLQSIKCP